MIVHHNNQRPMHSVKTDRWLFFYNLTNGVILLRNHEQKVPNKEASNTIYYNIGQ